MANSHCEEFGHIFNNEADRETISEKYYDCLRENCDYVDRRTK